MVGAERTAGSNTVVRAVHSVISGDWGRFARRKLAEEQDRLFRRFAASGDPSNAGLLATTTEAAPSTVIGDYQLLELLGRGGMGAVNKARHQQLGRLVALKVVREDRLDDDDIVARFNREIAAIGRLPAHPNVVVATDARRIDGQRVLVMEFCDGVDLTRLVTACGLEGGRCLRDRKAGGGGLVTYRRTGLVHRDIKPSNLWLTLEGVIKILDLGLAKIAPHRLELLTELTEEGQVLGTPDFMAPEQWQDSRDVDIRSDLYSLGCTLHYLLSGEPPFAGIACQGALARQHGALKRPCPGSRVGQCFPMVCRS